MLEPPKITSVLFWDLEIKGIKIKVYGKRWTDINHGTYSSGDRLMTANYYTGDDVNLTCHVYHPNDGTITEKMILDQLRIDTGNELKYCNLKNFEILYMTEGDK